VDFVRIDNDEKEEEDHSYNNDINVVLREL
jgi:hypothetical protein